MKTSDKNTVWSHIKASVEKKTSAEKRQRKLNYVDKFLS